MLVSRPLEAARRGSPESVAIGGEFAVRRVGFGAMVLTGPGVWGEPSDRSAARALLRRAVDLGVEFIDTADSYGPGASEALIAESLHPFPDGLVVATKGGYVRDGPWQMHADGSREHLRAACEASLRRLRVDAFLSTSPTQSTVVFLSRSRWVRWTSFVERARSDT